MGNVLFGNLFALYGFNTFTVPKASVSEGTRELPGKKLKGRDTGVS